MKSFWGWCLAMIALLGTCIGPTWAQGPVTFGWQRDYFTVPNAAGNYKPGVGQGGLVRLSSTRYVTGSTCRARMGQPYVPFVRFLNNQGDTLNAVRYPGNIYAVDGTTGIVDIQARSDGGFAAIGQSNDSLNRYGTLLLIGDSLGRLRARRHINMNYRTGSYYFRLFMLPDNSCLLLVQDFLLNGHGIPHLYRFDANGNQIWEKRYAAQDHEITTLVPRLDGSYALIGTKLRQVGSAIGFDVWVGGITAWGDTLPARRYPRLRGNDDPAFAMDAALMPDGGLILAGGTRPLVGSPSTGSPRCDGYLLRLGPTGQVLAQQTVTSPVTARGLSNCELHSVRVLASGNVLAVGPYLRLPTSRTVPYDAAVLTFEPTNLGVVSQQFYPNAPLGSLYEAPTKVLYEPGGALTLLGPRRRSQPAPSLNLDEGTGLLRLNAPAPYQPPYCQTPPVATFTATLGATTDTLRVRDASTPGPRYGQVVLWHWQWGDGSSSDGPTPGPHRYATVPAAGTPVTLTITNNLGCTSTLVRYPWGRPSATQAAQALAAALVVYPNPATTTAQVQLAGLAAQPPVPAALLDALGRAVWQGALPVQAGALAHALALDGLAAGVYTLRLLPHEGPLTRRLVVR